MTETKIQPVKASTVARVEPVKGNTLGNTLGNNQGPKSSNIDDALIKALEKKFDDAQEASTPSFVLKMSGDQAAYLSDTVIKNIGWKGLECYAVAKVADDLDGQIAEAQKNADIDTAKAKLADPAANGDALLSVTLKHDLLEAVFHFIRSHASSGYDEAKKFTAVAEIFVPKVNELTALREATQRAAVELEAAKRGMSPEEFVKKFNDAQGQGGHTINA
jgi:hypothetical protein